MNLAKLNLNLLLGLQALLAEGSVTRAAQRLHVTQSAMSKSLAQLRELFSDPLLVRSGNRTEPTLLARELRWQVEAVLQDIERLLQQAAFDPASCEHSFTLVASDFEAQYLLPQIFDDLYRAAPRLSLRLLHLDEHMPARLNGGQVDLCFCTLDNLPAQVSTHPLYSDHMVCVMSQRHPLAQSALTLDGYCAWPHVVNSSERGQLINDVLSAQGRFRHIRLEVPLFMGALRLVNDSTTLVTLPSHIARRVCAEHELVQAPLPFALPALEYGLAWPTRLDGQASHRWLRETLAERVVALSA